VTHVEDEVIALVRERPVDADPELRGFERYRALGDEAFLILLST
jgi:hypothetical protein